jgi:hypothetical protein
MTAEGNCPTCERLKRELSQWTDLDACLESDRSAAAKLLEEHGVLDDDLWADLIREKESLTARVAELEGERERLREAFWASHTSFEMMFTPQGFVAVDRKTRRHIGGPCEFAVDAALAALAPPEPHDSKEGK